jgi:hypothetical protein
MKYSKKHSISPQQKKQFQKYLNQIDKKKEAKDKIIAYDILYHKILLALKYKGSF